MEFIRLESSTHWITDPNSEHYNKILNYLPYGIEKYEKMKNLDHLNKYGIVINYNTANPVPFKGSAISIHVERVQGYATAGCIAVNESSLKKIISWLDPKKDPQIIMGSLNWLISLQ